MHIISDTASLISPKEGAQMGVSIIPACAIVGDQIYRDYEDISSEAFLDMIKKGAVPTTSQPAIGDIMDVFDRIDDEILFLSIGDGLSGAYQAAAAAARLHKNSDRIHVIDTKTLAGPQRYIVEKAVRLKEAGKSLKNIIEEIQENIKHSVSFVIPEDFDFLKRSGRLTPIAAKIGGLIKIVPVMTQTEDMQRIKPFVIKRSVKKAVSAIIEHFHEIGVNEHYTISISHGGALEKAKEIQAQIREHFEHAIYNIFPLSPALLTHGGPGSVVIQAVKL